MTARERRGAVALLRACGGDATPSRSCCRRRGGGRGAGRDRSASLLELAVFGPLVARLAAGFASLPLAPTAGQVALVVGGLLALAARRDRARRPPRAARADRRGAEGGVRRAAAARSLRRCARSPPRPRRLRRRRRRERAAGGLDAASHARGPRRRRLPRAGPGEPLTDRGGASALGDTLATFGQLTDTHVRDEESPARVPFLDRIGPPFTSTFRPQEAFSTQMLDAAVRALNRERPQAVVRHRRHHRQRAGERARPGARACSTATASTPTAASPATTACRTLDSPTRSTSAPTTTRPRHPGALAAAQRASAPPGSTRRGTRRSATTTCSSRARCRRRDAIEEVATGDRLVTALDPAFQPPRRRGRRAAGGRRAARAGRAVRPPEHGAGRPARRHLAPAELVARAGGRRGRAPGRAGRLDYTFDLDPGCAAIVLDTVNRDGGSRGV